MIQPEPVTLTITRTTSYADRIRGYRVMLDGAKVASLKAGEATTLQTTPGHHSLVLKIDWCRSNCVEFDARSGENLSFECGSSMPGLRLLLAILYITFWRHKYLWLRQVPSST
jgi:hypothetical protein